MGTQNNAHLVKRIRKLFNLTQEELGQLLGYKAGRSAGNMIGMIERGEASLPEYRQWLLKNFLEHGISPRAAEKAGVDVKKFGKATASDFQVIGVVIRKLHRMGYISNKPVSAGDIYK